MADVILVVREGPAPGGEHPVEDSLTLGREHDADLVLDDRGVSRLHAAVQLDDGNAVVEDLGSSNGTYVNGRRIDAPRRLGDGDTIEVGDTVLEVRFSPEITRVVPAADETEVYPRQAAQPPPAQPVPAASMPRTTRAREANWPAVGAIVLGPLSIILLAFTSGALFYVSLPCAVAAVILGTIGRRKTDSGGAGMRGAAVAGRMFGIVGAILSAVILIVLFAVNTALDAGADNLSGLIDEIESEIEGTASDVETPEIGVPESQPGPEEPAPPQ